MFSEGIKTYFAEYSFKNTKIEDFIKHMSLAATKVGIPGDFVAWCKTFLNTSGANIIWHDIEEEDGKITKFSV